MNITIVFHSVCGNSYLVAREFTRQFEALGHNVLLKRTIDPDWVEKPGLTERVRALLKEMRALPEALPVDLTAADLVLMGCPVYFGNVSAEMKAFMDATGALWIKGALSGRKFAAFTSAGNSEGGGDLCLQALHTYAHYMGLISIPLPVTTLPGANTNALGIIHCSQGAYAEDLPEKIKLQVKNYSSFLAALP